MTIEHNDIPPHEMGEAKEYDFIRYWLIKRTGDEKLIAFEKEKEANEKTDELNQKQKGERYFVVGPFEKDEKGDYFPCEPDIAPKRRRR